MEKNREEVGRRKGPNQSACCDPGRCCKGDTVTPRINYYRDRVQSNYGFALKANAPIRNFDSQSLSLTIILFFILFVSSS